MTRRARFLKIGFATAACVVALAVAIPLFVVRTTTGRDWLRRTLVAQVNASLQGRGTLRLAHLDGGFGSPVVADSLTLLDAKGALAMKAARITVDVDLWRAVRGDARIRWLLIDHPEARLVQDRDGRWNIDRIFASGRPASTSPSAMRVTLDSAEVREGRLELVQPDSGTKRDTHRVFSGLSVALGSTRIMDPAVAGGDALLKRLAVVIDAPPVTLPLVAGRVRWWKDSLALDLPELRLGVTHGRMTGRVSWAAKGEARIDLQATLDTIAVKELAWMSPLLPKSGTGSTELRVRNAAERGALAYELTKLDLRASQSRLTGALTAVVGRTVSIRDLALTAQPIDVALLHELFGESMPKKPWDGFVEGTVRASGGPLRAMVFDTIALTWHDRHAKGAMARLTISGVVDASGPQTVLHDFAVRFADMDTRVAGAVTPAADSLHGTLRGSLVLEGPTNNLRFHDLVAWHTDGLLQPSRVSGAGRIASDVTTPWLEATLSLDTIAPATLLRGRTEVPLRGVLTGTLDVRATGDTVHLESALRAGNGRARFTGRTVLDSTQLIITGSAQLSNVDPRVLFARRDIPALRLDGSAAVNVDGPATMPDAHILLHLDTTSIIGASRVRMGTVRAGFDSTGFHVDTAELHAADWQLSARGHLARRGESADSMTLRLQFAAADSLRSLLLDSLGRAVLDSLHGALTADGALVGSMESFRARGTIGVRDARRGDVGVRNLIGRVSLDRLPSNATGAVSLLADVVTIGGFATNDVGVTTTITDGRTAAFAAHARSGDTLSLAVRGTGVRDGDDARFTLDSLALGLGDGRWTLERAVHGTVTPSLFALDSVALASTAGAHVRGTLHLPDAGEVAGSLQLAGVGLSELAFTGLIVPDLAGMVRGSLQLRGTRDAPIMELVASLDSISVNEHTAPSIRATVRYADRMARVSVNASTAAHNALTIDGTVPVNLSLRAVDDRRPNDPFSLRVRADSLTLADFEGLVPRASGLGGVLRTNVELRGTWKQLNAVGPLRIENGAFDLPRVGFVARRLSLDAELQPDSITLRRLQFADDDDGRNTINAEGTLVRRNDRWMVRATSTASNFTVVDDPRLATAVANWTLSLSGPVREPTLGGSVSLPHALFFIDNQRRARVVNTAASEDAELAVGMPIMSGLRVQLGNDVRLKSREANVQLSGTVELAGQANNPYILGEIDASRGTYRLDLSILKRTFRVDSGLVRIAGTKDQPAALNIWTSYLVRSNDENDARDVHITAHLSGLSSAPRLDLSSDLGNAVAQSEIISYLVFGSPSFALDGQQSNAVKTATAALVPSLGGLLEGVLGTVFPFFSSLQVTTVAGSGPQNIVTSPLDGLLNSFAITGGRQIGTDAFLNLSGGVCRGSRLASTQSPSGWFGVAAEYRPRLGLGAAASMEPGSSPCSGVGRFSRTYQVGFDLFREFRWK